MTERWNWDGRPRIHSGAFCDEARLPHFDWASAKGVVNLVLSQYRRETSVVDATQWTRP
jgi:hypothetical protein